MMTDYQTLMSQSADWAQTAEDSGWLPRNSTRNLDVLNQSKLVSLFRDQGARPLIVAFFGGTGVGKSSLLNRLAGDSVARVGVQRPTSMEVSLYLHEDFRELLQDDALPTENTRIAFHNQADKRLVAWLDLPDIDSTETSNQDVVKAWLPYVDWMVYVVSPERYHDDLGWRFLQERGAKHAWLFVMNHWDQGRPAQLDDFRQKLLSANFSDPVLIKTSCGSSVPDDDFPLLESTISQAISSHGLSLLQSLGIQAQIEHRLQQMQQFEQHLGNDEQWQTAEQNWHEAVKSALGDIKTQLQSSATANHQAMKTQGVDGRDLAPAELAKSLWGSRANERMNALGTRLQNSLQADDLPYKPFGNLLTEQLPALEQRAQADLEAELSQAMVAPGTRWQRGVFKFAGFLSWILPLLAGGWAIIHVIRTFYSGTQGDVAFLGFNFAINAGLMIGLAFLLPWLIQRKLKPSMLDAVKQGYKDGINTALAGLKLRMQDIWGAGIAENTLVQDELKTLTSDVEATKTSAHEQAAQFVPTSLKS